MSKQSTLGLSKREYARRKGIARSYVQRLIASGKIPVLPDGSIDEIAADRARRRNTRVGMCALRQGSVSVSDRAICLACHWPYSIEVACDDVARSPDPVNFCTDECAEAYRTGRPVPKEFLYTPTGRIQNDFQK